MRLTYLDTSCLIRRAELSGPRPSPRSIKSGTPVDALIRSAAPETAAISEIGLAEFHDVVTTMWRNTNAPDELYDETWRDAAIGQTFDDLQTSRLTVVESSAKAIEQAITLITMATRQFNRKLRVWDAVHLSTAVRWSASTNERVQLWTTDSDYASFVNVFPHFDKHIEVVNLDKV